MDWVGFAVDTSIRMVMVSSMRKDVLGTRSFVRELQGYPVVVVVKRIK
jgi:hypothetical protein